MKFGILAVALLFGACTASKPEIQGGSNAVRVAKADPGPAYEELGPVSGENGGGCGLYGAVGTYEGAVAALKNKALALGGDYVQIVDVQRPYKAGVCRVNTFTVSGTAFRRLTDATPKGAADTRVPAKPSGTGYAERLRAAAKLYKDGLITEAEYNEQRAAILADGL